MRINKERAVYGIVLGAGVLALMVDRALLTPAGAHASADEFAIPRDEAPAADPAGQPLAPAPANSLANRMHADGAQWQASIRNGFVADVEWLPPLNAGPAAAPVVDEIADFVGSRTLSGLQGPKSTVPGAMVNNRFYRIGEDIDGWTLLEVTHKSAKFSKGELIAELAFELPNVASEVGTVTVREENAPASPPDPVKP